MILSLVLSILALCAAIYLAAVGILWVSLLCGAVSIILIYRIFRTIQQQRTNIVTILKAVKNSDYTFYLKEDTTEVNQMLNEIKKIIQITRKKVQDQELFLSIVINRMPIGVLIINEKESVRFVNNAALALLSLPVLSHLHRIGQVYPELYETLATLRENTPCSVTLQTEREQRQLTLERTTVDIADGTVRIITLSDINSQLDQRETDSWIALIRVMTHEIMNAIAPIRSISEVLLGADLGDAEQQAIRTIHDTSTHLIRFVNDYRQFSSVPQPQPETIETEGLLRQSISLFDAESRAHAITIEAEIKTGSEVLYADDTLILQVLHNLLKNALEATPREGTIKMTAALNESGRTTIMIYNSGEAISPEVRPYIFIPFFTTKEGGSGIGLSLARYIMRLHGGNLRYLALTDGSAFVLEF